MIFPYFPTKTSKFQHGDFPCSIFPAWPGWNPDLNIEALEKGVGVTSEVQNMQNMRISWVFIGFFGYSLDFLVIHWIYDRIYDDLWFIMNDFHVLFFRMDDLDWGVPRFVLLWHFLKHEEIRNESVNNVNELKDLSCQLSTDSWTWHFQHARISLTTTSGLTWTRSCVSSLRWA